MKAKIDDCNEREIKLNDKKFIKRSHTDKMEHLEIEFLKQEHFRRTKSNKLANQESDKSGFSHSKTLSSGVIRTCSPRQIKKKVKIIRENRDSMNAYPPQFEFEDIGNVRFFQQDVRSAQNRLLSLNSSASNYSDFRRGVLDFDEESRSIDIVEENSNLELAHNEIDRQNTESRVIPEEDIERQNQRVHPQDNESLMVDQAISETRQKRIKSQLNILLIYLIAYTIE
jgi:hypothetical protein